MENSSKMGILLSSLSRMRSPAGPEARFRHMELTRNRDPEEHSKRRRILGQLFSRTNIAKLEGLMLHHINAFVDAVGQKHGPIDVGPACRALEADIICTIFQSTGPDCEIFSDIR